MKLYVDADITPRLAHALRARGYDVLSAHETGNANATDVQQIAFAVTEGRALLTCNAGDFTALIAQSHDLTAHAADDVALSSRLDVPLITADARLARALTATPFDVCWLGSYATPARSSG